MEEITLCSKQERMVHFLPFNHSKRDERFTEDDSNKIAPAFSASKMPADPDKDLNTLRAYLG
jgi:hypothetical protein